MRITEEIRGDCGETCRRISGKGAPICCACAGEVFRDSAGHCRCWRELTWLTSGMATKAGLCVALYDGGPYR
jgi:hypothetical protein